jgi:serine/threonine protein kinase
MLEQVATENTRNPSLSPTLLWNSLQLFLITLWVLFVAIYFRQIKREISTMKLVKHPNIVQLLEVSSSSFPYS